MRTETHRCRRAAWGAGALTMMLATVACGASSPANTSASGTAVAQATPTTSSASSTSAPVRPVRHLRIASPRAGSHTDGSPTVRVIVTGTPRPVDITLRYIVDGGRARRGSTHFTLHGLRPGRHHLVVRLAGDGAASAGRVFVVTAPPPPPAPVTTAAPAPAPTTTAPPAPSPPPTTTTTSPSPPPAPTTTASSSPPAGGGIPQNGGGDGDGDNSGGPTDGDGNI
jgi:hypothetical protein